MSRLYVQEVGAGRFAKLKHALVVIGHLVERLRDREGEHAAGVGVHQTLADVVLDCRVVGYAQTNVNVALARRVALGDVDRAHRDAAPDRRGTDQEPRINRLVVGGGAVAERADDLIGWDLNVVNLDWA